jgi:aminoglycoside phosphotransferase (APT) family kinase protein
LTETGVVRITTRALTKVAQDLDDDVEDPSEAHARNLVFTDISIPVPRVHRIVKTEYSNIIVMDFIPGQLLSILWPSMSFLRRLWVGIILRRYIRQLRTIRHPRSSIPGPLATHGARVCESPVFGKVRSARGPFPAYEALASFFNDRHALALEIRKRSPQQAPHLGRFDDSVQLVLTHQNLNPRNLIVGDDGRLWVVDWAWAGFYPRWFEFIDMTRQAQNEELLTTKKEPMWDALVPFICDPCFKQEKWLEETSIALSWI